MREHGNDGTMYKAKCVYEQCESNGKDVTDVLEDHILHHESLLEGFLYKQTNARAFKEPGYVANLIQQYRVDDSFRNAPLDPQDFLLARALGLQQSHRLPKNPHQPVYARVQGLPANLTKPRFYGA